jgi:ribosomal-protein-alanine N-acetyltransferase
MNIKVFEKFPDLKTARVDLRQVSHQDLELVYAFNASLEALRYVARDPYTSFAQAEEKVQGFLDGFRLAEGLWWTFVERGSGLPMGYGGLFEVDTANSSAEIGYGLLPDFWGRGYITEIVEELVRFGFQEMRLDLIHALVVPGNQASEKVLLRHGFQKVGVTPDHSQARGRSFDMGRFEREK